MKYYIYEDGSLIDGLYDEDTEDETAYYGFDFEQDAIEYLREHFEPDVSDEDFARMLRNGEYEIRQGPARPPESPLPKNDDPNDTE